MKGLLPNLQEGIEDSGTRSTEGAFWVRSPKGRVRCDPHFNAAAGWEPTGGATLEEALSGWFKSELHHVS